MGLDVIGSFRKLKVGDKIEMSGPNGMIVDGTVPALVMKEATFEDWKNSEPKPNMTRPELTYKNNYFYWVSID